VNMSKVSNKHEGLEDVIIACTDKELEALRIAVKNADGRKSEVKLAREVLGV